MEYTTVLEDLNLWSKHKWHHVKQAILLELDSTWHILTKFFP